MVRRIKQIMRFIRKVRQNLFQPHYLMLFGATFFLVVFLALISGFNPADDAVGRYLSHSWRSIKKFPNIIYFPLFITKSNLPEYRLIISANNLMVLDENLPINRDDLTYGFLSDKYKNYVNATFISPQDKYAGEIKVRYRGLFQNNWQAEKKALRLKFPKDNIFKGMKSVNLMIPEDRGYFLEPLNMYRAKKLGLFAPDFSYVRVFINNRDFGVYLMAEAWSPELLAKNNITDSNNIFSNKDEIDKIKDENPVFFNWKSYTAENEDGPFEELNALSELTNKAGDEEFQRKIGTLVDLEKVYRWQIINVLAGSAHQSYMTNFVLLFRQETGKFEPVPWNVEFEPLKDKIYDDNLSLLVRRIFKSKPHSDRFVFLLERYLDDDELRDDLAYYDNLAKNLKTDFYKDQAKNKNNFEFSKIVKEGRKQIESNFEKAELLVRNEDADKVVIWEILDLNNKPDFGGSFKYFNDAFISVDQFIVRNPQFKKINNKTVALDPGISIFSRTTVVPINLRLDIEPGAVLLFYPKVSLISYSPVSAIGSSSNPIIVKPAFPGPSNAWGVLGIITDSGENHFQYIHISGGSSDMINGVNYTSQLDIRNSVSRIEDSVFEESRSDDGLHVILGSVELRNNIFKNNSSDGVDLDYVSGSVVTNSKFFNSPGLSGNNGDGIDLSGAVDMRIYSNEISYFGDKCISIGEKSQETKIEKNILAGCDIGIAVKDDSAAQIINNIIIGNKTAGISSYRKKQEFIRGGDAHISDSILWGNGEEVSRDNFSSVTIEKSVVQNGFENGVDIQESKPNFRLLVPAYLLNLIR